MPADNRSDNQFNFDDKSRILVSNLAWEDNENLFGCKGLFEFVQFLDKYARHNKNDDMLLTYLRMNWHKTLIHRLTLGTLPMKHWYTRIKGAFGRKTWLRRRAEMWSASRHRSTMQKRVPDWRNTPMYGMTLDKSTIGHWYQIIHASKVILTSWPVL